MEILVKHVFRGPLSERRLREKPPENGKKVPLDSPRHPTANCEPDRQVAGVGGRAEVGSLAIAGAHTSPLQEEPP